MPEVTTIIKVTVTVHDNWPGDPHDLMMSIEDHLWETFNDDGSLRAIDWVPESEVKLAS
ncbi:hypothetical protein LCGC14_1243530 [marine sediment metagenome]|uniref:Uncharacterized protein n=1 Tax=marine sediment metagenome TaxID=412755 RepID=A0A0F9L548_9ZZZZ